MTGSCELMKSLLALLLLLVVAACAVVEPAVFRDPRTGEVHVCGSTASGGAFPLVNAWTAQHEIDTCAAAFGRMGWIRQ